MIFLPSPEDSLTKIAQQQLGDWRRWREIADLNGSNVLQSLPLQNLQLPELRSASAIAQPLLSAIAAGRNGGGNISALLQTAADAAGYSKQAQQALGAANGVLGAVESIGAGQFSNLRSGAGVQLVDWLLQ
jgi:hypothetical protein